MQFENAIQTSHSHRPRLRVDSVPVFCLPGDPTAARRGVEELVVAQAPDLVAETSDDEPSA